MFPHKKISTNRNAYKDALCSRREWEKGRSFFLGWETIKPVIPSLREKKRYLHYVIEGGNKTRTAQEVKAAVQQAIQQFLGDYGCAQAGIMLIENTDKEGILKVNTPYVPQVKTALALIKQINKEIVMVKTTKVSGMINNVKRRK